MIYERWQSGRSPGHTSPPPRKDLIKSKIKNLFEGYLEPQILPAAGLHAEAEGRPAPNPTPIAPFLCIIREFGVHLEVPGFVFLGDEGGHLSSNCQSWGCNIYSPPPTSASICVPQHWQFDIPHLPQVRIRSTALWPGSTHGLQCACSRFKAASIFHVQAFSSS